jgi:hypothetical protein
MLPAGSISQQPCVPDYSASFVSRLVYDFSPSRLGLTEFDVMFVFVLIILLWWWLTTYVFPESWNQKIDFSWLKWHVWLVAVMTYLVVEALAGFWIYEYQGDPMAGFCRVHGADHVEIPGWLWSLASNAPLVAVLTIVMLIWHVRSIREAKVENRWKSDLELTVAGQERCFENCRLMVIVLPALFGTAAVWSLMRIWEVLFDMHGAQDLIVEYVSLIRSTLVLAEGVEFVAIAAFVQMCLTCIMQKEEHSKDLIFGRPPVWWLAQTGVLSVVVVGMFRQGLSLCQLRTSSKLFNRILEDPTFSTFVTSMLASTGTLFDFVTLLLWST